MRWRSHWWAGVVLASGWPTACSWWIGCERHGWLEEPERGLVGQEPGQPLVDQGDPAGAAEQQRRQAERRGDLGVARDPQAVELRLGGRHLVPAGRGQVGEGAELLEGDRCPPRRRCRRRRRRRTGPRRAAGAGSPGRGRTPPAGRRPGRPGPGPAAPRSRRPVGTPTAGPRGLLLQAGQQRGQEGDHRVVAGDDPKARSSWPGSNVGAPGQHARSTPSSTSRDRLDQRLGVRGRHHGAPLAHQQRVVERGCRSRAQGRAHRPTGPRRAGRRPG